MSELWAVCGLVANTIDVIWVDLFSKRSEVEENVPTVLINVFILELKVLILCGTVELDVLVI